ncbi:MAG TPA: AAA family ATPase [Acidimicrobiales bacterium]|nr:AAA family ATPase [Acidimicrobiales bacterium]
MSFVASRSAKVATPAQGERYEPAVGFVITGVMASGKSTVAELIAQRFERSVHLRGDVFRKMIVRGRDPITPELGEEALRQLDLRQRIAADVANDYWRDDFTVVLQDIYVGAALPNVVGRLEISPLYVVVLNPRPDVVTERERQRDKVGYGEWDVAALCATFEAETPHIGVWLDTSSLSADQTVDEILLRRHDARVR